MSDLSVRFTIAGIAKELDDLHAKFNALEIAFQFERERLDNVRDYSLHNERELIAYMDKNPKYSDQWIEARLRKLEEENKTFMELYNGKRPEADSYGNDENIF